MCKNRFPIKLSSHGFNERYFGKMAPFLFANARVRNSGQEGENNLLYNSGEVLKGETALGQGYSVSDSGKSCFC